MTSTTTFEKSIRYDRETRDYRATLDDNLIGYFATYHDAEVALDQVAYDQLMDGIALTGAEPDGGSDVDAMADPGGIHVNQYTVTLSQPDQAYWYELRALCDACRAKTSGASKMGEIINGYCDQCGVGPSVSHYRLESIQARCANCDGPHSIQQCPAIRAALFAPSCPRCGGRHALADCPQRGPAEPGMLTSQGSLASRCRIEPADDNLEYVGFLDGVLVGIYSTVMTADLALANLAWASDHGLIARVQRCPGAAV